jgi:uncharacterized protein
MRIDVRDLELRPLRYAAALSQEELDFDPRDIQIKGEVGINLLVERSGFDVRVRGTLRAEAELTCSRCLEPAIFPIASDFDQLYESNAIHPLSGEIALQEKDTDIGFFSGDTIEINDIIREQILLALPMKPICRADCKGLCPHCGKNLNAEACGCETLLSDPRLAELSKIRNRIRS